MAQISKKDIIAFSRVLSELADYIGREPEVLLDLLAKRNADKRLQNTSLKKNELQKISEKAELINLFDDFKGKSKEAIFEILTEFSKDDLLFLIKKFNLGYTRFKSQETIADYIADIISKRNTDVFINQK
ncbi:hypothetical protein [Serratia plymuthica]|uniref:Uncharacterized protein n=1 Tax=Serratia plymuthica TaxID=82996 RepID=A0A7T2SVZ7_SERPL|nr:hypothetical protein [Serratia plymuthica]QPS22684.1 hypothetical protein I6G64_10035 [Serratia plymuthica]QPS64294.1 hypothetical protein I6G52_05825 [Serratia plymuthica]RKS63290.1 hypothetical protein C8E17_2546 [Serratia plymuthica]CAI2407572.1 Uncharacterised protein [Serratia plymuthica]